MMEVPFAMMGIHDLMYAIPLIIVISLVYSATRHELMAPILRHSLRIGVWIVCFMAAVSLVLELISW